VPFPLRGLTVLAVGLALAGCSDQERGPSADREAERRATTTATGNAEGPAARPAQRRRDRGVRLLTVGRFASPVYVTAPPGDRSRVFVVERGGTVRVIRDGRELRRPFLDISDSTTTDGERGLLSMAFAPDYARSRRLYVYYTDLDGTVRVDEWRRSADSAERVDPGSRRAVIAQPHGQYSNHNGGQVAFGPDGLLYIGPGDGGGSGDPLENAQNLSTLLGKILRIDPRRADGRPYGVPDTNPFATTSGARPEIYSYGLRNPFRFSFDRRTGDMTIADQGQNQYEEINWTARGRARGANFGWDAFEGRHRFEGDARSRTVPPALERSHSRGYCSITGGYVIRDRALGGLYGRYVYSDLCTGQLRSVRLTRAGARADRAVGPEVPSTVSFGEDARGRVYAVSIGGAVFRLVPR
jgi:glucose/arabinose dehydrogenase